MTDRTEKNPRCKECGEIDPEKFYSKPRTKCKDCMKEASAIRYRTMTTALDSGIPNVPKPQTEIGSLGTLAEQIETLDEALRVVTKELSSRISENDRLITKHSEKATTLEQRLARLESTMVTKQEATRAALSKLDSFMKELDEKYEDLRENFETNIPEVNDSIYVLKKRLDEDDKDARIIKLEKRNEILTKKVGDLGSKLGIFKKRLETLEKKTPNLLDTLETTDFDVYSKAFKSTHDKRFFTSPELNATLFAAIWKIATFVIDDVEQKRSKKTFVWSDETYNEILSMDSMARNEEAQMTDK